MARSGALQLCDYPTDMVRLACDRCPRKGQYRKLALIDKHGADIALPDLCVEIAACENTNKAGAACGAYYLDLA